MRLSEPLGGPVVAVADSVMDASGFLGTSSVLWLGSSRQGQ
jgi:hypothetical protein